MNIMAMGIIVSIMALVYREVVVDQQIVDIFLLVMSGIFLTFVLVTCGMILTL